MNPAARGLAFKKPAPAPLCPPKRNLLIQLGSSIFRNLVGVSWPPPLRVLPAATELLISIDTRAHSQRQLSSLSHRGCAGTMAARLRRSISARNVSLLGVTEFYSRSSLRSDASRTTSALTMDHAASEREHGPAITSPLVPGSIARCDSALHCGSFHAHNGIVACKVGVPRLERAIGDHVIQIEDLQTRPHAASTPVSRLNAPRAPDQGHWARPSLVDKLGISPVARQDLSVYDLLISECRRR